jgi:hypothetical protein
MNRYLLLCAGAVVLFVISIMQQPHVNNEITTQNVLCVDDIKNFNCGAIDAYLPNSDICEYAHFYITELCAKDQVAVYNDISICAQKANLIARGIYAACTIKAPGSMSCKQALEDTAGGYYTQCIIEEK